jgi:starvation-inducible DNA-binding protein
VDPRFYSLHKFFEEQYENLAEAVDEIAERIRMIGGITPATMREFLQLTTLKEGNSTINGDAMLHQLLEDHEVLIRQCHHLIEQGNDSGDDGSSDLCIQRLRYHEKTAWMIRSHFIR